MPQSKLVAALKRVVAIGRQLVIVDVQKCFSASDDLVEDLMDYAEGFDDIVYIWDGDYNELDEEYDPSHDMHQYMLDHPKTSQMIKLRPKNYGFLNEAMDIADDDTIVKILSDMLDGDFESREEADLGLFIPEELEEDLEKHVKNKPILVGGGRERCLKETYLLLKAMGLDPEINEQYTY